MATSTDKSGTGQVVRLNKKNNYYCCVPCCNSSGIFDNHISFHKFPKNEEIRRKWIVKIKRDLGPDFQITSSTVVCSKHFIKEDYTGWTPLRQILKRSAVPTVFDWSELKSPRRVLKRKTLSPKENKTKRQKCATVTSTEETLDFEPDDSDEILTAVPLYVVQGQEIKQLKEQLEKQQEDFANLSKQLEMERFLVSRFAKDDKMVLFYTGFSSYNLFVTFFKCIEPSAKNMLSKYYEPGQTLSLKGRKRNVTVHAKRDLMGDFIEIEILVGSKRPMSSELKNVKNIEKF